MIDQNKILKILLCGFLFVIYVNCKESSHTRDNGQTDKVIETDSVVDYFNRTLYVNKEPKKVITLFYQQAEMVCVLGCQERISAIGMTSNGKSPILENYFPSINGLPQIGYTSSNFNHELLIGIQPDIIFCSTERKLVDEIEDKNFFVFADYPRNIEAIETQIRNFGKVLGQNSQADSLTLFLSEILETIHGLTSGISEDNRPKVYYARTNLFTTLGAVSGNAINEIIWLAGGKSVTDSLVKSTQYLNNNFDHEVIINPEQLIRMNPDIIIVRDRAPLEISKVYSDPRLQSISAIQNRKIFRESIGWSEFRLGTYFGLIEKAKWFQSSLHKMPDADTLHKQFIRFALELNEE